MMRGVRTILAVVLAGALLALVGCGSGGQAGADPSASGEGSQTNRSAPGNKPLLGENRSGLPWASGVWIGGESSTAGVTAFERWLDRPTDAVTTYVARESFQTIADSEWHITTFNGYQGRLVMGLPLLPNDGEGSLAAVGKGEYDWVWQRLAKLLVKHDRGNAIIRVGLEGNGFGWGPWGADQALAADYRAAFRRVAQQMRTVAPDLLFDFNIACGVPLTGGDNRLDAMTELYPGDDVVDIVGCDIYDQYTNRVKSPGDWHKVGHPPHAAGPDDLADFARQHGKRLSVPEWGLWKADDHGGGDNPVFIEMMHAYFLANADILAYEAYFDEPDDYIRNSLFRGEHTNPTAAEKYRELFRA